MAHGLSCSAACGSSWTRAQTRVPCIGRRILNHCASREAPPCLIYLFIYLFNLFIYLWLCWVFVAVRGLCLVAASGGYSSLKCAGFSLRWLLVLRSTGSRCAGFSSCGSRALERRLSSCGSQALERRLSSCGARD